MRPFLALLSLLTACDGKGSSSLDTAPDPEADADTDADTDADSDADSDADCDADVDADTDADADLETLTFDLSGEGYEGAELALTWLNFGAEDLEFGAELASTTVEGAPQALAAPPPGPGELQDLDGGGMGAFYVPSLEQDGEIIGAGLTWALYLAEPVPAPYEALGLRAGWNALTLDPTNPENPPTIVSIDEIPLSTNLLETDEIAIGGTYSGSTDLADQRLALVPQQALEGAPIGSLLYDAALAASWSIEVSGPPPADHLAPLDLGIEGALEVPLAYLDLDGSEDLSGEDLGTYAACAAEGPVLLLYSPPLTDLSAGLAFALSGLSVGWNGLAYVEEDDALVALSPDQLADLTIDDSCTLD